jgi:hypothetical protein
MVWRSRRWCCHLINDFLSLDFGNLVEAKPLQIFRHALHQAALARDRNDHGESISINPLRWHQLKHRVICCEW